MSSRPWNSDRVRLCVDVSLRVVFALVGGYLLANLGAVAFTALLPLSRVDAALVSIQLSFAVYACAVVWVFTARSAWRAILGLVAVMALCTPVVLLLLNGRLA